MLQQFNIYAGKKFYTDNSLKFMRRETFNVSIIKINKTIIMAVVIK